MNLNQIKKEEDYFIEKEFLYYSAGQSGWLTLWNLIKIHIKYNLAPITWAIFCLVAALFFIAIITAQPAKAHALSQCVWITLNAPYSKPGL